MDVYPDILRHDLLCVRAFKTMNSFFKIKIPPFMRSITPFVLFGLMTQVVSILQKPKLQISDSTDAFCNFYITKFRIFNVHLDCDAQYFLLDSQDPLRILRNQTPLQDRPLYTFVVYVFSKILNVFGIPSGPITYLGEDGIPQTYFVLNYGIFIALNSMTLLVSMCLALSALKRNSSFTKTHTTVLTLLAVLLISQNPISREFFWTPHSQIFNILIPCLLFFIAQREFLLTKRRFYLYLLLVGIGSLIYSSFYLILPILFLKAYRTFGIVRGSLVLICLAPRLVWPFVLSIFGGNYSDVPIKEYRRFIWVKDAYDAGNLPETLGRNLIDFSHSLPVAWALITLILIVMNLYYALSLSKTMKGFKGKINGDLMLVLGVYLLGIVFNGQYGARFTSGLIILFGLITLNVGSQLVKAQKFWWAPLGFILMINSYYWLS